MCVELGSVHQNPHRPVADFGRVDPLRLTPVDDVSITVLADNSIDILSDDRGPTRLPRLGVGPTLHSRGVMGESLPDMLVAEHGLSLLVTYQRQDRDHTILFDSGVSPHGVIENMRRLDIDVRDIETIVCSHGHFDHMGGLHGICQAQKRTDLPVVLHPDFWLRRRQFLPGAHSVELPTPSRTALAETGVDIVESRSPSFLFDDAVLITGEVPRVTGYEPGLPPQQAWIGDRWQSDSLVLDDQAMILHVRDRGLVVLTGCGHAGIVNTARYAKELTGVDSIHALVGGFHLSGKLFSPIIPQVVRDIEALHPNYVVPGHCTGWQAQGELIRSFGDRALPSSVGMHLELGGAS